MGAATVSRLQTNAAFLADLKAAKAEMKAAKAKRAAPAPDCAAEATTLSEQEAIGAIVTAAELGKQGRKVATMSTAPIASAPDTGLAPVDRVEQAEGHQPDQSGYRLITRIPPLARRRAWPAR